uniref:Uncharacterized protein n=1 Tax=Anguilla anguilla TaxID=7936 RepID=A0A0E9QTG9_ANGAN
MALGKCILFSTKEVQNIKQKNTFCHYTAQKYNSISSINLFALTCKIKHHLK